MIPWDTSLETGIAEIDEQHRLLFRKASVVLEAVAAGHGGAEVKKTIQFLSDYAAMHFGTEEKYMRLAAYPALAEHLELHARMLRRLEEIGGAFDTEGASAAMVADLEAFMRGWLTMHIQEKDRALAAFLSSRA
jgi:hemerythrin-like metal-binding protein